MVPVNGTWKGRNASEVSGEVAVLDADALGVAVEVGFGPESRTASGGTVEFEFDVVETVGSYTAAGGLEAGLEV